MAAKSKAIVGQIVGHELCEKTESGGYPVKVKMRIPITIAGELLNGRLELFVEKSDMADWPLGKGVNIAANLSQTEIDFDADTDEEGDGDEADSPAGGRARRGRRGAAAPVAAH